MTRHRKLLAAIALAIVVASLGSSALTRAADGPTPSADTKTHAPTVDRGTPAAPPMIEEIEAVIGTARARTQELQDRLEVTTDPEALRVLQDEVEAVKFGAHLRIFEIQRDWARREGRDELAQRLTDVIATMQARRTARAGAEAGEGSASDPR